MNENWHMILNVWIKIGIAEIWDKSGVCGGWGGGLVCVREKKSERELDKLIIERRGA